MKTCTTLLLIVSLSLAGTAQTAKEILDKSIQYHDPNGEWRTLKATFYFTETRPNGPDRKTVFTINNARNEHTLNRNDEEIYEVSGAQVKVVKGDKPAERGQTLRNYYLYLWGLPMKLLDANTPLNNKVGKKSIDGNASYVLTVNYEKEDWTYYFDQKSFQLIAYGFKKKDGSGQEEFVALKDEIKVGNMRLPKARSWYESPANKFLGTDILDEIR
jgi:hypothetical protein